MPDSVRPGQPEPLRLTVVASVQIDVELPLLDAHPVHPRVDLVYRHGNHVGVANGTPSVVPVPPRLPDHMTPIARIDIPPCGLGIWPGQITILAPGKRP
nr:hypothetical protein KPHV_60530 [Kitasatospora purpeofusca]